MLFFSRGDWPKIFRENVERVQFFEEQLICNKYPIKSSQLECELLADTQIKKLKMIPLLLAEPPKWLLRSKHFYTQDKSILDKNKVLSKGPQKN